MGEWVDGWDWLVVCWGMMWTPDSYGVGCIRGVCQAEWRGWQTLRDCLPTSSQPTCPSQHLSDRAASVGESKNGFSLSRY